jgi:hypothetical protein
MPAIRKSIDHDVPEIVAVVNAAFQVESDFLCPSNLFAC